MKYLLCCVRVSRTMVFAKKLQNSQLLRGRDDFRTNNDIWAQGTHSDQTLPLAF